MAEEVTDPDGRRWIVRRRWVPRLPGETLWGRFRRRFVRRATRIRDWDGAGDLAGSFADGGDGIAGCLIGIGIVVGVLLLLVVVIPFLLAFVEVLVLVLLALLAVGARILFRRPWTVEAVADDGELLTWRIVGLRASGEQARKVAWALRAGPPPPGLERGRAPDPDPDAPD